ncbi:MAG: hypothetical protein ACLUI3_00110 [Christensenellales bacterium]
MNTVQPYGTKKCCGAALKLRGRMTGRSGRRNELELPLAVGFSTSLRISDISRMQVRDIAGTERCRSRRRKREKSRTFTSTEKHGRGLSGCQRAEPNELVFASRQKDPETECPAPLRGREPTRSSTTLRAWRE